MLALGPGNHVVVLLAAIVDGLVTGTLGVHVHDGADEARLRQAGRQCDGTISGVSSREGQLCRRTARLDNGEILAGANPASPEAVGQVGTKLPIQTAIFAVSAEVGVARISRRRTAQVDLKAIWSKVSRIHVAAEELNLIRKLMIQAETCEILLQPGGSVDVKAECVETISDTSVRTGRHHIPQRLDGRANAETTGVAKSATSHGSLEVVLIGVSSRVLELKDALTEQATGHNASRLERLRKAAELVVGEEKCFILDDRSAELKAAPIIVCSRLLDAVLVVVPGVGVEGGVLVEPIDRAVKRVAAALAYDVDLAAGRTEEGGVLIRDLGAELIDAFHTDRDDGFLGAAAGDDIVGDVDAVHDDAVLIAACTGDGAAAVAESDLGTVIRG